MDTIKIIENELKGKSIELSSLDKDKTVLIVVDMVNGFVYSGPLSSDRVASIAANIAALNEKTSGCRKVFFLDSHEEGAKEFGSFPIHCLKRSEEASLIPELDTDYSKGPGVVHIEKNSTNGFNTEEFRKWLDENIDKTDNFIVTGCVTDICVLQFALSLKAYFNQVNENKRIVVPSNCVETYDGGSHDGYLMNLFALYNMHTCGIEIVDKIN